MQNKNISKQYGLSSSDQLDKQIAYVSVAVWYFDPSKAWLLLWIMFVFYVFVFVWFSCLFIAALWSPDLLYVMYYCVRWCLIVSIPNL